MKLMNQMERLGIACNASISCFSPWITPFSRRDDYATDDAITEQPDMKRGSTYPSFFIGV